MNITLETVFMMIGGLGGIFGFAWAISKWTARGISQDIREMIQEHRLESEPHPGKYVTWAACQQSHQASTREFAKLRETLTTIQVTLAAIQRNGQGQ